MATAIAAQIKDLNHSIRPLSRLVQFFAKYPPSQYSSMATGEAIPTSRQRKEMGAKPLSSTNVPRANSIPTMQNVSAEDSSEAQSQSMIAEIIDGEPEVEDSLLSVSGRPPNPFLPYRNPETGRWRGARIGLRQQADLCRYAREYGVEGLLPASVKSSTFKQQRALERGLAVKGTGQGQQVKGHKWERTMASTLEKRRKAMENMPELIREWEQRGHGRGWKKYPR